MTGKCVTAECVVTGVGGDCRVCGDRGGLDGRVCGD